MAFFFFGLLSADDAEASSESSSLFRFAFFAGDFFVLDFVLVDSFLAAGFFFFVVFLARFLGSWFTWFSSSASPLLVAARLGDSDDMVVNGVKLRHW